MIRLNVCVREIEFILIETMIVSFMKIAFDALVKCCALDNIHIFIHKINLR